MNDIIQYIISFLLYGNNEAVQYVGYTNDENQWDKYPIVIVPNGHLGADIVVPDLGEVQIENRTAAGDKPHFVIHTDIIYNTFFFISRAEELINNQRDEHGRFLAKYSILGHNNRLMIPTVDEYARLLIKLLNLPLPTPSFSHIYLTHDVDSIANYRHLRGALGGIWRGQWRQVLASLLDIHDDPAFTFPWLISQDKKVKGAQCIYFVKDTLGKGYDYPQYKLDGKDFKTAEQLIKNSGATIGLHSSYYGTAMTKAVVLTHMINNEATDDPHTSHSRDLLHRSHYLRCSIDDMQTLLQLGITDDFTMMFPDQVGFRLQTTRAVRWINPKTMTLTDLVLHPLTIMDCTLISNNYMHLSEDEAYFECQRLLDKIYQNSGEVVLLWHNTNTTENSYHHSLYPKLLKLITVN